MTDDARIDCWARCLGGCTTSSREHVISRSVLQVGGKGPVVTEGLYRIPDGQYDVNALVARVLCRKHNSALANLDGHVGVLSHYLNELHRAPANKPHQVDGTILERWVCKTVVSYIAAGWTAGTRRGVNDSIVRFVFGLESPPNGVALYSLHGPPLEQKSSAEVRVQILWAGRQVGDHAQASGAVISLNGVQMFLTLTPEAANAVAIGSATWFSPETTVKKRPIGVTISGEGGVLGMLLISWPRIGSVHPP